jgi:hypothetical protein
MARWHRRPDRRTGWRPVPSPPPGYWPAARQPSAARIAARLTGRAVAGYARWVARAPETRGLASGLVALYPAGEITHALGADPALLGAFGAPAALAAWTGTWKAHRSARYSAAAAATAAGGPAWRAAAAATGITHPPILLGYTAAAAAGWSAITWSDVLRHRRAWRAQRARWETIASTAGLEGSRLVAAADTRTGQKFTVDIRATGKTARALARGDLADRIAAILALPAERVRIATDPRHAGNVVITVQTSDPWAGDATHPALASAAAAPPRSVMDGPLIIGTDPDTGADLGLVIYGKRGGQHTLIVAATGGGKTTLYSNLIEQATRCTDVLVWAIDVGKGTIPAVWAPALDASAGIDEFGRALAILSWAVTVTKERSRVSAGRNHVPTPAAPVIFIPIDEMDTLIGTSSPIRHKAGPLVDYLFRRGRSAGVELAIAGQRGTITHTGSKDPHANAANKIILRVNRAAEMNNVVPGWELAGMPDMSAYAPGIPGVALIVDADSTWRAGRIRDLSDLDAVEHLARRRGQPTATLEPHIVPLLDGYPNRHHAIVTAGGASGPGPSLPPRPGNRDGEPGQGWDVDPHDQDAIGRLARGLVAEVEARLAGMPAPPGEPTPLADLIAVRAALNAAEDNDPAINRAIPVPEHVADPILALLDRRGDAGARRDEVVTALGRPESTVKRWLRIMRDHGLIVAHGSTSAARYYLPEHAPDEAAYDGDDTSSDREE